MISTRNFGSSSVFFVDRYASRLICAVVPRDVAGRTRRLQRRKGISYEVLEDLVIAKKPWLLECKITTKQLEKTLFKMVNDYGIHLQALLEMLVHEPNRVHVDDLRYSQRCWRDDARKANKKCWL